ncbi:MAG: LuxR C-terminal-related transcriptional regulator [Phycisphaerales bacterium]
MNDESMTSVSGETNRVGDPVDHPTKSTTCFPELRLMGKLSTDLVFHELLTGMCAVSIMVWDDQGTIITCNDIAARGFQLPSIDDLIGKNLYDFAPKNWASERYQVAKLSMDTGKRITFLEILGGSRLRTMIRPMTTEHDGKTNHFVLVTVEQISEKEFDFACSGRSNDVVVHANVNDLGKLDVLTSRELEVLALMGKGMRAKDIAKELSRSLSTIDNHRNNIGDKLNIHDRGELIALAKKASLTKEDATRQRVQFSKHIPSK